MKCEIPGCENQAKYHTNTFPSVNLCGLHALKYNAEVERKRAEQIERRRSARFWRNVLITPLYPFIWSE